MKTNSFGSNVRPARNNTQGCPDPSGRATSTSGYAVTVSTLQSCHASGKNYTIDWQNMMTLIGSVRHTYQVFVCVVLVGGVGWCFKLVLSFGTTAGPLPIVSQGLPYAHALRQTRSRDCIVKLSVLSGGPRSSTRASCVTTLVDGFRLVG